MILESVVLECADMEQLISFYSELLDWPVVYRDGEFVRIQPRSGGTGIAVQYAEDYIPPVWPSEAGEQQMMAHLDFGVAGADALRRMRDKAVGLGARLADTQYGGEDWVTLLDPAGHPFCLVLGE